MGRTHCAAVMAVVLVAALAGCTSQTGGADEATFAIAGTFTEAATQEEMEDLRIYVEGQGGSAVLMESFPVQFRAAGLTAEACDAVRSYADSQAYVADVASCSITSS